MPYLLLDLDLTVFSTSADLYQVNKAHQLSKPINVPIETAYGTIVTAIQLINPIELSDLLDTACSEYDGVIFFTAGNWSRDILPTIVDYLDISKEAEQKLLESPFFCAPSSSIHFPDLTLNSIRHLPKSTRWQKIVINNEYLAEHFFVFLDDNPEHVESFKSIPNVLAIHADTEQPVKDFYHHAKQQLKAAKNLEILNSKLTPVPLAKKEAPSPAVKAAVPETRKRRASQDHNPRSAKRIAKQGFSIFKEADTKLSTHNEVVSPSSII